MRRVLFATLVVALVATTACQYNSGTSRRPEMLGKTIWDIAYPDLERVNEILDFVAHYNYYIAMEEGEAKEEYLNDHLKHQGGTPEIEVVDNTHTLTYSTYYNTTYSVVVEMSDDLWHVQRSGGNSYDMTIRKKDETHYTVEMSSICYSESEGLGSFYIALTYDTKGRPEIEFTGTLEMVDGEENSAEPLTITTQITSPLRFSNIPGYTHIPIEGYMTITVQDAHYGTTDEIVATLVTNKSGYCVSIECLDTVRVHLIASTH